MKSVRPKGVIFDKVNMENSNFLVIQTTQAIDGYVKHVRKQSKLQKYMKEKLLGP